MILPQIAKFKYDFTIGQKSSRR